MKIEQKLFTPEGGWQNRSGTSTGSSAQFALVFGGRALLEDPAHLDNLRAMFPGARLIFASTSGEITGTEVTEDKLTVTAVSLDKTRVAFAATAVTNASRSYEAGRSLARQLAGAELRHVFALSDGQLVNGGELARGFNEHLPAGVTLTGGLAGDGTRFQKTLVGLDEMPVVGRIVAVAFYGLNLHVGFGSSGGWVPFGPERIVTRSTGNTLFELDGQSALRRYKEYLGEQAAALPGSALRFPLCVTPPGDAAPVVRTILSVDEASESMVFAGDVPIGSRVHFMRASYEDLIDGAGRAAESSAQLEPSELAICVSCVGRRIVLGQRTEEETECVREILGPGPVVTGFYSYGELAPVGHENACQLHNQTMTITTLRED